MCIIAVKPKGKKINKKVMEVLENCWIWNSDGAGLMMPTSDGVQINKGFMDWDELELFIEDNKEKLDDSQVVFHFRWATHGMTNQENCHPFPVTNDVDLLESLEVGAKIGMVHNGIIDQVPTSKEHSDTFLFVQEYLSGLGEKIFDKKVANFIADITCSKYVFMSADKMIMVGNFIPAHGMFFSNDGYMPPVYTSKFLTSVMLSDGDSCKSDSFGAETYSGSSVCVFCNQPLLGWYEDEVCMECEEKYSARYDKTATYRTYSHDDDVLDEEDLTDTTYDSESRILYLEDGKEVLV